MVNKQEIEKAIETITIIHEHIDLECSLNEALDECMPTIVSALEQQLNGGWIPVSERLPEEKISPITHDYYEYECTFNSGRVIEVRHYKFGDGHWWHGGGCVDEYITAWRERLEPYKEVSQ